MPLSPQDAQSLTAAGLASLRRGDNAGARNAFDRLAAEGSADATVHVGLAYACQGLGDHAAARAAVDAALVLQPRDLRALMLKGDYLYADGDVGAAAFYDAVLTCAPPPAQLPPELQQLVARARAQREKCAQRFEATLRDHLAAVAQRTGPASPRFAQSLDLLAGSKQIYFQAPRLYYFPELPQVQFYERADFPWLDAVEAATDAMREELIAVLGNARAFAPYVQGDPRRPQLRRGGMLDNPDWGAYYLWKNGQLLAESAARCPRTVAALAEVPMPRMSARSPSVLFSLLRPRAHIPPHHGFVNTRLIVHLPLIVPSGCRFRVGNETRAWVEGQAWLFDDTIEHEAWNDSDHDRVVLLLFEVWRPELTAAERAQVTAMFEAIDQARGGVGEWSI